MGISCSDNDYKISWHLSQILNSEFAKADNLEIIDPKFSEFQSFSVYENYDVAGNNNIKIVSNKGKLGFLIEELKNIDFFLIIFENEDSDFPSLLSAKLKTIDSISAVFKLKPENLKSKEKLLF